MKEARLHPTTTKPHGGSKIGCWWTHELVGYALDRYHRRHLRIPTVREVRLGIDELPSYATVCKMYGSFGRMLRHHGYRVRARGRSPANQRSRPVLVPRAAEVAECERPGFCERDHDLD